MLYDITVPQFTKVLHNLSAILDKGAAFAETKKVDVDVLLRSRLAPDQFDLMRQVQIACDTAKNGLARLAGKEPPVFDDTEKTLGELKSRIEKVCAYLETLTAKDFADGEKRQCSQPRWNGQYLEGKVYAIEHVIPNFYFHVATAYAILRHNGVDIGKKDYLGSMPLKGEAKKA